MSSRGLAMPALGSALTAWLGRAHPAVFSAYGGVMAFGAYFAMYAYRKPFAAASFEAIPGSTMDYKTALVVAQLLGYALSKFIGIRVIAEIPPARRAAAILWLILLAELALLGFALVPAPYNIACLFLNGLPLGMIWGLVFGFLEGRRVSDVLGSILCASFIVSSGVVKSVGKWTMVSGLADAFWMPSLTGLMFAPLLIACVAGLARMPPPTAADEAARKRRAPMDAGRRRAMLAAYAPGLVALILLYVLLTALRDFRDNFSAEIFADLGYGDSASVFALSELPVALIVLTALAGLGAIRDNFVALMANFLLVGVGLAMVAGSTALYQAAALSPLAWMILLGAGLYLAYTPFSAFLFDRFVATADLVGTAGFLIYVADASGYAGSVGLMMVKTFAELDLAWSRFLALAAYLTAAVGGGLLVLAALYFRTALGTTRQGGRPAVAYPDPPGARPGQSATTISTDPNAARIAGSGGVSVTIAST